MISIRQGVFETNSSSMHSIAIRKQGGVNEEFFGNVHNSTGYFWVFGAVNYYERYPFRALTTMLDKALYAIASMSPSFGDWYKRGTWDETDLPNFVKEVYTIIQKYLKEFKGFDFNTEWKPMYIIPDNVMVKDYALASASFFLNTDKEVRYECIDDEKDHYYVEDEDGTHIPLKLNGEYVEVIDFGYVDHQSAGLFGDFLHSHDITLEEFLSDSRYVIFIDGDEHYYVDGFIKSGLFHNEDFEEIFSAL